MRRGILTMSSGLCVMITASVARAQAQAPVALQAAAMRSESVPLDGRNSDLPSVTDRGWLAPSSERAPWWAPVLSSLIPGAGQFAMGQQRSVGYLVAEGYLIIQQVRARRDANGDRDAYRALAFDVARQPFGGDRPRGSWDYYESMEKYLESGAYDRIPGGSLDPETDETTYNGARWLLARQTYWLSPAVAPAVGSPEYQRALAFYQSRAVRPAYQWSWRDAQLERDVFAQTIASANRSGQRAVNYVGLIGANHLVSLIDAYVSVRVRRFGGAGVLGLSMESVHTAVETVGDPLAGRRQVRTAIRLVHGRR